MTYFQSNDNMGGLCLHGDAHLPHKNSFEYIIKHYVFPYLGMVGRFRGDDPVFGISDPIGSLFYTAAQTD